MMNIRRHISNIALIAMLLLIATTTLEAQSRMRVQGVVVSSEGERPINRVAITSNYVLKGYSDVDGKFSIVVDRDAELLFHHAEYVDEVRGVDESQTISVALTPKVVEIEKVVIESRVMNKGVAVDMTDIDMSGNYLHLKTKFRINHKQLKSDYRFVAQPTIKDVTTGKVHLLRPIVIDGNNYDIVEHRHLYFAGGADSLERFVVPNEIDKENNIYSYKDSIYINSPDLNNDYLAECYLATVTYREPSGRAADGIKVMTIANGTVNPLRFFDFSLEPMQLDETILPAGETPYLIPTGVDTLYLPNPELELCNSHGSTNIEFEVNKATVTQGNRDKIEQIGAILRDLQGNPDATLRSISMVGYASPEGSYYHNKELADMRTAVVFDIVSGSIEAANREYIELSYHGAVASWEDLATLISKDNNPLAEKLYKILNRTNKRDVDTKFLIYDLPEYRSIITPQYLPQLRRVEYDIDYSLFRPLTYEEIRKKYDEGLALSRYEYYNLIIGERDLDLRGKMERDAIASYPNYTIFANRAAISLIESDSVDLDLLAPLLQDGDAPLAIRYNQAVMALNSRELTMANSLVDGMDESPVTEHIFKIVSLLNGDTKGTYPYFEQRGGLNEILILLMMERNKEANMKIDLLMASGEYNNDARYHYIKSLCANRLDDIGGAMAHLQIALELDPTLKDIANVDSDILDIYELIRADKEENNE